MTALGADTVSGLRVLRGIGGEQVFLVRYRSRSEQVRRAGVRVALPQSTLDSAQVLLPGIFVVIVTWLGARLAVDGRIRPGELVAFFGYAAFLVIPLRTAADADRRGDDAADDRRGDPRQPDRLGPVRRRLPAILIGTRWYLRRAPEGYPWERAAYATMTGTVGETVDGGRTVEALSLGRRRVERIDADLADAYRAERRTLYVRIVWFSTVEIAYVLPVAAALVWGGWLVSSGRASIGDVTAVALYVQLLADPVDRLISWLDEIQVGATSFARLMGVAKVPDDREATGAEPEHDRLRASDVRYAYVDGRDVLHGFDLDLKPGERIAVVGPSGAGKSTLGRLLAGIHPPRTGRVKVGDVRLVDLKLESLRREVALVTQEQHVFIGTLADNLRLARVGSTDEELPAALAAVDALPWTEALSDGLETVVGAGGFPLTPPQQQQVALARLVLADPPTLVLDEATSLLPRAARRLESSLASVLEGRTVVAIAHRLQTAHDADRVAVVEDGKLAELGTHDELVEQEGSYAALWDSWHHS